MMNDALKKAGETFKKDMLNLKNQMAKLPDGERQKMQEIEKNLMNCYKNGDVEGLQKTIAECHKILLGRL